MKLIKLATPLDPNAYSYESNPARLNKHMDVAYVPSIGGIKYKIPQKQDKTFLKNNYEGVHLADDKEKAGLYAMQKSTMNDPPVIITLIRNKKRTEHTDVDAISSNSMMLDWINENKKNLKSLKDKDQILEFLHEEGDIGFDENFDQDPWDSKIGPNKNPIQTIVSYFEGLSDINFYRQWNMLMQNIIPKQLSINFIGQFREMKPIYDERVVSIEQYKSINLNPDEDSYAIIESGDEEEIQEMLESNEYTMNNSSLYDHEGKKIINHEDIEYGGWLEKVKHLYLNPTKPVGEMVYHGTTLNRAKQAYPNLIK